jgi:hypothetical protein
MGCFHANQTILRELTRLGSIALGVSGMRERRKPTPRSKRNIFDWLSLIAAVGLVTGVATMTVAWKPVPPAMMARAAQ